MVWSVVRDSPSLEDASSIRRQWRVAGRCWIWGVVPGRAQCYLSPDRFKNCFGWRHAISEAPPVPWPCACGPDSTTELLNQSWQLLLGYRLLQALSLVEKMLLSEVSSSTNATRSSEAIGTSEGQIVLNQEFFSSKHETCIGKSSHQDV